MRKDYTTPTSRAAFVQRIRQACLPHPDDPWAITAPCDPSYRGSWYGDDYYYSGGEDADAIRDIIARGMEVD